MVHELAMLKYMLPENNEESGREHDMLFCFYVFHWVLYVWFLGGEVERQKEIEMSKKYNPVCRSVVFIL